MMSAMSFFNDKAGRDVLELRLANEGAAMTTITLEVPDELAVRVEQFHEHLPALLHEIFYPSVGEKVLASLVASTSRQVFDEMIGFLASGPTAKQIIDHKVSEPLQIRLRELLDKNREEGLTKAESAELDLFESVDDLMALLKVKALHHQRSLS